MGLILGRLSSCKCNLPALLILRAADVTYNTASFPSLVKTLTSLMIPKDRDDRPRLLMAYKQRDPAERELWGMLEKEGVEMTFVQTIRGAERGKEEVELWIGQAMSGR